jgi:hypothetical protein
MREPDRYYDEYDDDLDLEDAPETASAPNPADEFRARAEAQIAFLMRMTEVGMRLAEEAAERAFATPREEPGVKPAAKSRFTDYNQAFTKASRLVRQCIALENRLRRELLNFEQARRDETSERSGIAERVREKLRRLTEGAGEREAHARAPRRIQEAIQRLAPERAERLFDDLDDYDLDVARDRRPAHEIVKSVLADFGLSLDWDLDEDAEWIVPEGLVWQTPPRRPVIRPPRPQTIAPPPTNAWPPDLRSP